MNLSRWRSHLTALITTLIAWATAGTITEFPTTTAGPDGNLWFTEENASKIGRITTQ